MTNSKQAKVLALSGGVGGAKLALGLANIIDPQNLTVVVNTADDFEHLGLSISPDIDTLLYTLAGESNQQQGWGLKNETWQAMTMLNNFGGETWFQLGDRDIGTHLMRSQALKNGKSLSQVTELLKQGLGVKTTILPMSDQPVRTMVQTPSGPLSFQHYFVREQCQPQVTGFNFNGLDTAQAQPEFLQLLQDPNLGVVVICPSNPFVSVEPMLQLPNVKQLMKHTSAPVIAVSPIVAGLAIKGPAAKMMQELNMPTTALAVAQYYGDLLDGFIIDESDADQASAIAKLGIEVLVVPTIMKNLDDKIALSEQVMKFSQSLAVENLPCGL